MEKRLTQRRFMLGLGLGVVLCTLAGQPGDAAQFTNTMCGYTITVPDGWNASDDGCRLTLANFAWENLPAFKLFTPGGARITIQVFPPYINPVFHEGEDDDAMLADLATPSKTVISRTGAASGTPARMTMSERDTRYVNTVIHKGGRVFVFMLACGTDDHNCPGYEKVLDDVIASLTLTATTPAPGSPTP